MWNRLKGIKTYLVLTAGVIYYVYGWQTGHIVQFDAVTGIVSCLAGMGFRSAVQTAVEKILLKLSA